MNITKNILAKQISNEINIPLKVSLSITNSLISLIKKNSKLYKVKINGFGTFYRYKTSERIGRNPKTRESYIIRSRKKLNFKASHKIKEILN